MSFEKQASTQENPMQQMAEGGGASMAPPAFNLAPEPMQLTTNPHGGGCDCADCFQFIKEDGVENASPIHGDEDQGSGGATIQRATNDNEATKENETDEITPTYTGKEFTIISAGAKLLDNGKDEDGVDTFGANKKAVGKNYPFGKGSIPKGAVVELVETDTSYDKGKNKEVAKVKVVSVPEGAANSHVGKTYWTTRSNVSAEAKEDGNYTITDGQATIRLDGEEVMGYKTIPGGTKVNITDTKGIDQFPEDFRLKNNAERNAFHKDRYMRLYLLASWTAADGTAQTGWIKAKDVEGGFSNEVLGVAEIPEKSLESNDPNHMTVGTAKAPLLKKGDMYYPTKKKDGNKIIIEKGTYVQIIATSSDGKYVQVSSEDNSVSGEWTSKGNLDLTKKKEVGEPGAGITFYEVTDSKAYVREAKQGFVETGSHMTLGQLVEVKSVEGAHGTVSKATGEVGNRTIEETQHWIEMAHLAPGWSTDLKGTNASWGVEVIGGKRLTKYKGQDEMVNLGGSGGKMKQVSKVAYPNLMKMINAAKSNTKTDGTADPVDIQINSCFRTFFSQKYFDDNENKPGFNDAAPPGRSDHQDSNAFDLNNRSSSKVYTWLKKNAWKYDIVQNVQKQNEKHHWAYLPGKGKEGYYTTWGTPSNKSW